MFTSLITAGTFVAIALAIYVVGRLLLGGRNRPEDAIGSKRPLVLGPLTGMFAGVFPTSAKKKEKIRADVVKAGFYHRRAADEFLALRNAAVVGWMLFIGLAVVLLAEPGNNLTLRLLVFGGIVLILIYSLPGLVLGSMAKSRVQKIQFALPDALDMINMMVSGGLPVRRSIHRVGEELHATHPALACELAIINHQAEAGSLEQALKTFAQRIDVPEVIALATMVRHADRLGGNVATAFRDYSDSVRRERRQRAEERGNKAAVKLLFPMVLFLAPPIYILLLGPAVLELRSFMTRENQPGGMLTQQSQADANGPRQATPANTANTSATAP